MFLFRFLSCCSWSGFRRGHAAREETGIEGESLCFRGSFVRQGVAWEGMFLKGTFMMFIAD